MTIITEKSGVEQSIVIEIHMFIDFHDRFIHRCGFVENVEDNVGREVLTAPGLLTKPGRLIMMVFSVCFREKGVAM